MHRFFFLISFFIISVAQANYILMPMDANSQNEHLKAYGIAYWELERGNSVQWLLNYRGGSFLITDSQLAQRELKIRGVDFEIISEAQTQSILAEVRSPSKNMDAVLLETAPKIAVYSPDGKLPWDDAVTLVLTYAEIPYTIIYDKEVLNNELLIYDWLHLHHEDFTGQYGKFYRAYRSMPWYIQLKRESEELASSLGFSKVSDSKLAVAQKIRDFVIGGGFMFAMCSATDTFDIALSAEDVDICEPMFDGDSSDPAYQNKIDYTKTFAFTDFILEKDPMVYSFSSIDTSDDRQVKKENDYFRLMDFSAKWDPIPTMLVQNHTAVVKNFYGQTTSYKKQYVKSNVLILGENKAAGEVKYLHGVRGKGFFTFYGGHDPEDYQHKVGDPPTELELHPNSPGYRLILNNILFPAAEKKEQKT